MSKLLMLTICLSVFAGAWAQEKAPPAKTDFLEMGAGWAYSKNRDKGMSPLLYKGGVFAARAGYLRQRKVKNLLNVQFYYGGLAVEGYPQRTLSSLEMLRADVNYLHLRPFMNNDDRFDLFLGGAFTTTANVRNHNLYGNNSYNYDVMSSLGIAGEVSTGFELFSRQFTVSGRAIFPVASFIVRPYFASSMPSGFQTGYDKQAKRFLQSAEFSSFGSYTRLNTEVALTYHANNGNGLKLNYNWDLYSIYKYEENTVTAAHHALTLSLLYNLGK